MSNRENRLKLIPLFCTLFWLLFALVTCIESYRLLLGTPKSPGSGFFPFCAGFVMLVLAAVALFQTPRTAGGAEKEEQQEPIRWWNIPIILAAILGYALSLETVGFLINTFLFITLMLKVIEPQSWKTALLGGAITAIVADVLFNLIFKAQIPAGILGF